MNLMEYIETKAGINGLAPVHFLQTSPFPYPLREKIWLLGRNNAKEIRNDSNAKTSDVSYNFGLHGIMNQ